MERKRRHNIEGTVLDILLQYDEGSGKYMEIYPDFIETPIYTPAGYPILFTGEDACAYAESADGGPCIDCGSCRFYRQAPNTLIGVCGHPQKRCKSERQCKMEDKEEKK